MSAFTVAAAIAALDGADWLPNITHWEIATTDGVWGAHAEIDVQSEAQAYRLMEPLAELHASKLADDGRLIAVDFAVDEVSFRFWWLRPIERYIVPEQCATCPTKLGEPEVSFVRLGVGSDAPVICLACRDLMHERWIATGDVETTLAGLRSIAVAHGPEVLWEVAEALAAECAGPGWHHPCNCRAAHLLRRWADEAGKVSPAGAEITRPGADAPLPPLSRDLVALGEYGSDSERRLYRAIVARDAVIQRLRGMADEEAAE
ncbi:hypothetical protein [Streptomyces sp. NPDC005322]|uniref:hypothetical protein n=1 Tax=Streptomyces sp. NPDC005322 TaxID=3157032 RepID=UPI0033A96EB7